MPKLHPFQEKIFQIFKDNGGSLPSFRQLAKELNVSSTNTVAYHMGILKKKGFLAIDSLDKGMVELNLLTLLNLESKSGVYVILKNKKPIYVNETEDIKNDIIEKFIKNDSPFLKELKEKNDGISIAYSIIEDQNKRNELKTHLQNLYRLS
ncbi:MAG: hypothetical protein AAB496_02300 [Patescibacteria group bacterium]